MIETGPLPKISRRKMSERLACGSTENSRTFFPWRASQNAHVADSVVFPKPPLPPNMIYRRSGWLSNTSRNDMGCGGSAQGVGDVFLAQHAPFPRGDLRGHVRQKPERIVRREDRDADQVSHRDQNEEMLHAGARAHRVAGHLVRGHAVDDVLEDLKNANLLWFILI